MVRTAQRPSLLVRRPVISGIGDGSRLWKRELTLFKPQLSDTISKNIQRFELEDKPVLISGRALEYYGIRQSDQQYDADYDFIISQRDYKRLKEAYPDSQRDICGDKGVTVGKWEFWTSFCAFSYGELACDAEDAGEYLVVSIPKMLMLKVLVMHQEPRRYADVELIKEWILRGKYPD